MFDWLTWFQIVPVLVLLYFYINRTYSYWSSRGVRGPKQIFPFGYYLAKVTQRPDELEVKWQKEYGKVYGLYTGLTPTLTICDHELIKQVLVKDFPKFLNRRALKPFHPIWNLNQFNAESEDWKKIRSITSPTFTSGKLRSMYPLMGEGIDRLAEFFTRTAKTGNGVIDTKEVIAAFTMDVIASTAFATKINANEESDKKNIFLHHGINFFKFSPLKVAAAMTLPRSVLNLFKIYMFFPSDSYQFIEDLTRKIVEQRMANPGAKRNDFIQLLIDSFTYEEDLKDNSNYEKLTASAEMHDSKNEKSQETSATKTKKTLTKNEIIGQCIVFFVAGFETTATTISFSLYELAQNPAVQQRLREEVEKALKDVDPSNQNEIFDKILHDVPYLDAVLKETLRKYPPVVRLERRVGVDGVKLGGIQLDKGVLIEIPTVAVQRNPEYYPDPERYNPERFMPENKHLLTPYTYLPFGDGPRNCVGMRFAYQEAKLCLAQIVSKFSFAPTSSTPTKLTIRTGSPMMNCFPFDLKVSAL